MTFPNYTLHAENRGVPWGVADLDEFGQIPWARFSYGIKCVFDFLTVAQIADVKARTRKLDLTAELQAFFDYCTTYPVVGFMPGGTYRADNNLWAPTENTTFKSVTIRGAGLNLSTGTVIDTRNNLTGWGLNIAVCRNVDIQNIALFGPNYTQVASLNRNDYRYDSDWVGAGVRDSRYSPNAGILIDGACGPVPPDGGYPGVTYRGITGGSGSRAVKLRLNIRGYVVGYMGNCEVSGALQGDDFNLDLEIDYCKISMAQGQAQSRKVTAYLDASVGRSGYSGGDYGQQQGAGLTFINPQIVGMWECFYFVPGFGVNEIIGGRAESVHLLGRAGTGSSAIQYPVVFDGFDLSLLTSTSLPLNRAPIVWDGNETPTFYRGNIEDIGTQSSIAYGVIAQPFKFTGQLRLANRYRPFLIGSINLNNPVVFDTVHVSDGTGAVDYNGNVRVRTLSGRFSAHWTATHKEVGTAIYDLVFPTNDNVVNITGISNWVYDTTTVQFDAFDPSLFIAGDPIFATFIPMGASVSGKKTVGYRVTGVAGSTVTCSREFAQDYYAGEDGTATSINMLRHVWAPAQAMTGDTHSNTTLDNVSPDIGQVGDWITAASGLPANCRITAIPSAGTYTLNKAATDTAVGKTLYDGRLNTVGLTPAF